MATKTWKLVVTAMGAGGDAAPLHDVSVEAENWMTALRLGRGKIGETGTVPPGASCAVSPDGRVTIFDAATSRQYLLVPATTSVVPAALTPASGTVMPEPALEKTKELIAESSISSDAVPTLKPGMRIQNAAPNPTPERAPDAAHDAVTTLKPERKLTLVGHMISDEMLKTLEAAASGASVVIGSDIEDPPGGVTIPAPNGAGPLASVIIADDLSAQASALAPPAISPTLIAAELAARSDPDASVLSAFPAIVLGNYAEGPTATNPVGYRERSILLGKHVPADMMGDLLREHLHDMQTSEASKSPSAFFRIGAFDSAIGTKPAGSPLAELTWKSWRKDPEIKIAPPRSAEPSKRRGTASDSPPSSGPPGAHDDRLAHAFEACQELSFFESPAQALDFAVGLLQETVPSEAIATALYDINADELRFVATLGTGAKVRKGQGVPRHRGLLGAATEVLGSALLIEDVTSDKRYDAAIDGCEGLDAHTMIVFALEHEQRLLGLVQLTNRQGQAQFSRGDAHIVTYVGQQLTECLRELRAVGNQRKSMIPGSPKTRGR